MNNRLQPLKMIGVISVLILAALIISACGSSAMAAPLNDGKITICHATSGGTTPYSQITIDFSELNAHVNDKNDIIPAPAAGCPEAVETGNNTGKVSICHATGSTTNHYNEITIDFNGLNGHSNHKDDIIPAPAAGCPSVIVTPGVTTTPAATTTGNNDQKVTICHATGSTKNPYVSITVSVNGLNGHGNHPRDIIPAPAGGCPK